MGTDSWAISTSVREMIPVRNEYRYRKIREEMLVFLTNGIREIFYGTEKPAAAKP